MLVSSHAWVEMFTGNIAELDYVSETNAKIQDIKKRYESHRKTSQRPVEPSKQQRVPQGYGVYFFPPIVIGEIQKPTPSDILRGRSAIWIPPEKALDTKFNEYDVIVNKDGFVFVAIPKKDVALKALNTIMAVGILRKLALFAVREHELSENDYDKETMEVVGLGYSFGTIRSMLFEERMEIRKYSLGYTRISVNEESIRSIIKEAADIFKKEKFIEELRLLIEAYTHLNDAEYAQSFVMSWSIIERHVSELWRNKLEEKNPDEERMSKLLNTAQWSIDYLLEVLNLTGQITETEYDTFMEMKSKRNKFIHRGKQIAKEDAERCFNIAKEIVVKKLNL